ncbi:MAG: hypothetical protein ACI4RD_06345 [Kiritimatiellia bacterium]
MEDLQSLLEKINRDGVEKAEAEAGRIVAEARAKADALVASARAEAEKTKAEAEQAAEASAARAAETIRQAARDVVLGVKDALTALFERLLAEDVDRALADEQTSAALVAEAIRDLAGPGEIVCGEKLAKTLGAQLAARGGFSVVTDGALGTGFTVKLEGGRVEHAFTGEVIAAELARRLRPELAKLLK